MIKYKFFVTAIFFVISIPAQYQVKCDYLKTPENAIAYVDSCAKFWFNSYDTVNGGFYENVTRDGNPSGTSKTMLGQSRTAYGMIKAFMLTGDTTYLMYARGTLDFMYEHAWDTTYGGWNNEMDKEGNIDPSGSENNRKWSFMQNYALLGICAMVDATKNEKDISMLTKGRQLVDSNLWDSRNGLEGYFNEAGVDWSNPTGKGFTPTMDGITTHILNMYLLTGEEKYKERLIAAADNVIDYMLPAMEGFNYGYPEEFTSDWEPVFSNTYVFTGHLLKSAWCVMRAYLINPKQEYVDFSNTILDEVYEQGYDTQYGGCYKEYNGSTGQRYDNNKEWWELEQMFTSAIMNYYVTKNDKYLQMADETMEFYKKYFVDHQYGEVFQTVSRTGTPTANSKASYWKAGYHSVELGYYIYLYTNLYILGNPVSLYYKIEKADSVREFKLYPVAVEDSSLRITGITLNGKDYQSFVADTRVLTIPEGTGGIFKITYENDITTDIEDNLFSKTLSESYRLYQNYPNPFNPSTNISFSIPAGEFVTVKIFNMLGQEIAAPVHEYRSAGDYNIKFDASGLASGIYLYTLEAGKFKASNKMILMK